MQNIPLPAYLMWYDLMVALYVGDGRKTYEINEIWHLYILVMPQSQVSIVKIGGCHSSKITLSYNGQN